MLGLDSVEQLFAGIPESIRLKEALDLPPAAPEPDLLDELRALAGENWNPNDRPFFLGAGCYNRYIPPVVDHLAGRAEFYTAYTPYQPEVSQGTLQAIYEYQSVITMLTGLDVSNASSYDGATALADAVRMAAQITSRRRVLLSRAVHPQYREVVRTYVQNDGMTLVEVPLKDGVTDLAALRGLMDESTAAVVLQNPNFFGVIEPGLNAAGEIAHGSGALYVLSVDAHSLSVLKTPGEVGADIATGEGQPLGNPMGFGGPSFGFLTTRMEHVWKMPGRVVGRTLDRQGRVCYVLTLQAREQHIKRERATSNICTNQALCALRGLIYVSLMGREGLREAVGLSASKARYALARLTAIAGVQPLFSSPYLFEFAVRLPESVTPAEMNGKLLKRKIIGGFDLGRYYPEYKNGWLLAFTELTKKEHIDRLAAAVEEILHGST